MLTALEQNTVSRAMQNSKILIEQIKPILDELNTIYNSSGGLSTTITQGNLDLVPSFSGLTKTQLDDGMYALTATLRGDLSTAYAQLSQLSARA